MRLELIHPMIVHFPLALLFAGVCLRFFSFFWRKSENYSYILFSSWVILTLGVCSAWLAVVAGEIASDIVRKNLCDTNVLHLHSQCAYKAAILFTCGLIVDWGKFWRRNALLPLYNNLLAITRLILFTAATFFLASTGYLGGSLVYEQGAAVENCCAQEKDSIKNAY